MVLYKCEKCDMVFNQKGHFERHKNKKKSCDNKIIHPDFLITSLKNICNFKNSEEDDNIKN